MKCSMITTCNLNRFLIYFWMWMLKKDLFLNKNFIGLFFWHTLSCLDPKILKVIICLCLELIWSDGTLITTPNGKKIDQQILVAWTKENFHDIFQQHIKPNCNIIFLTTRNKMLHSNNCFHFVDVNIFSINDTMTPLQNNIKCEK